MFAHIYTLYALDLPYVVVILTKLRNRERTVALHPQGNDEYKIPNNFYVCYLYPSDA